MLYNALCFASAYFRLTIYIAVWILIWSHLTLSTELDKIKDSLLSYLYYRPCRLFAFSVLAVKRNC